MKLKRISSLIISLCLIVSLLATAVSAAAYGDLDSNGRITKDDAIYALFNSVFGNELYPTIQNIDFNKDGEKNSKDAIYLLYHSLYPEEYPLVDDSPQPFVYSVPLTTDNWDFDSGLDQSVVEYKSDGSAYIETGSIVGWSIPQVAIGKTVIVNVKGSSVGGFRMWLLSPGQATTSNIVYASELGFTSGDFDLTFPLTVEDHDGKGATYADAFCFKANSWNTQLDHLLIESITITYPVEEPEEEVDPSLKTKWVTAWGSAQLSAGNDHLPKNVSLSNNTVRMQIRPSISGDTVKFTFSNERGGSALTINAATVAHLNAPSLSTIDTSTLASLKFNGSSSVTIPAGATVTSDELAYSFDALDDLAITLYLGSVPSTVTSHTASRCSTWVSNGNGTATATLSGDTTTSWYFLSRCEVLATPNTGAIVCLGDSLTDGASITTNGFSRWTDELARQLNANGYDNYSVVNMGIGATSLMGSWGDAGQARFSRDVLNISGVKYLVILYGVNDIGYANSDISQNIINTYKNMITQAHAAGIKVYGCTITPFYNPNGNQGYYSELHEQIRLKVNEFIRSSDSGFDGYIDTAAAVANPSDTKAMQSQYVSVWGDWLHFNDAGYKFVGRTIYNEISKDLT